MSSHGRLLTVERWGDDIGYGWEIHHPRECPHTGQVYECAVGLLEAAGVVERLLRGEHLADGHYRIDAPLTAEQTHTEIRVLRHLQAVGR